MAPRLIPSTTKHLTWAVTLADPQKFGIKTFFFFLKKIYSFHKLLLSDEYRFLSWIWYFRYPSVLVEYNKGFPPIISFFLSFFLNTSSLQCQTQRKLNKPGIQDQSVTPFLSCSFQRFQVSRVPTWLKHDHCSNRFIWWNITGPKNT